MTIVFNFLASIGAVVLRLCSHAGRFAIFVGQSFSHLVRPPFFWKDILDQIMKIGYYSLPVVALTLFFTGAVFALQIYYGNDGFNSELIIARVVVIGVTRELGPVLTGLMVSGRIAAAIAAELGSMRVTQQIDALITLSTNPYKYLVVPRLLAAIITMPILLMIANTIGIMGGYVVSTQALGFNSGVYLSETLNFLTLDVIRAGMIKASCFGAIIALIGSFQGFYSQGGAQGVGQAATNAVVVSSVLILSFNYVLTSVFFSG
jgi:phospholipid/cholesterol/gamma-HCH transport system permease protein